jgi:hypothetical protein
MLKTTLITACLIAIADPIVSDLPLGAATSDVLLSGKAMTCFNTSQVPVGGVSVGFYRLSSARPLAAHLDSMARFPGFGADGADSTAGAQFDAMEAAMQSMATSTAAIYRRTSASDGTFSITISPVDTVLVLGYENMEDENYVWDYKIMPALISTTFVLDMSRGQCGY